jgi:hypothetical protein
MDWDPVHYCMVTSWNFLANITGSTLTCNMSSCQTFLIRKKNRSLQSFSDRYVACKAVEPVTFTKKICAAECCSVISWKYVFFVIPFYLQSVLVHSANCVENVYNGM